LSDYGVDIPGTQGDALLARPLDRVDHVLRVDTERDCLGIAWPRLRQIAPVCYMTGRIEAAIGYVEAIGMAKRDGRDEIPFGLQGLAGAVYLMIGPPQRRAEWRRAYWNAVSTHTH